MRLNLKDSAKEAKKQEIMLEISERLPSHIEKSCQVTLSYQVKRIEDYYLVELNTKADLDICCMRCTETFTSPYENQTVLAVCNNDTRAEKLLQDYECIVSSNFNIDLTDIITDELYLYSPQFHPEKKQCSMVFD